MVRSQGLGAVGSAVLVSLPCGASVFYLCASGERNALLGAGAGIQSERSHRDRLLASVRHLLLVSAALLLAPTVLLGFLIATAALSFATVCGQVADNWLIRGRPDGRGGDAWVVSRVLRQSQSWPLA